jgi:hypothetical protein
MVDNRALRDLCRFGGADGRILSGSFAVTARTDAVCRRAAFRVCKPFSLNFPARRTPNMDTVLLECLAWAFGVVGLVAWSFST